MKIYISTYREILMTKRQKIIEVVERYRHEPFDDLDMNIFYDRKNRIRLVVGLEIECAVERGEDNVSLPVSFYRDFFNYHTDVQNMEIIR